MTADVAFLVNDLRFFTLQRLDLALSLRERGYQIRVFGRGEDRDALDLLRDHRIPVTPVPLPKSVTWPWHELRTTIRVSRVVAEHEPMILHNVGFKAVVHGSHAALRSRETAVVNHVNGLGHMYAVDEFPERFYRFIMNLGFASSFRVRKRQRIIVQNHDDRDLLISEAFAPPSRITVILGSGVDPDRYTSNRDDDGEKDVTRVLFAGRLLWTKGVGDFVETARELRNDYPSVRWVIVGESDPGNEAAVPREQLERWDAEPNVELWGWRDDMVDVYNQVDVICLPTTYREGVPKVLIEAAACELPLVATDVPGCREIVRPGETGFLVPPRDVGQLREALRTLLDRPDLRRRMGTQGRDLVRDTFSLESVVDQTEAVYRDLLR